MPEQEEEEEEEEEEEKNAFRFILDEFRESCSDEFGIACRAAKDVATLHAHFNRTPTSFVLQNVRSLSTSPLRRDQPHSPAPWRSGWIEDTSAQSSLKEAE